MRERSTVHTDVWASGRKLSTLPISSFPSGSHHWEWTVKLWSLEIQYWEFTQPLYNALPSAICLQILYTGALLPDDARWRPQARDKSVWLMPTRLHHDVWQSADHLVMLRESESSYFTSHCKTLNHDFSCLGISHLIWPILELSWPLMSAFHRIADSWKQHHMCLEFWVLYAKWKFNNK